MEAVIQQNKISFLPSGRDRAGPGAMGAQAAQLWAELGARAAQLREPEPAPQERVPEQEPPAQGPRALEQEPWAQGPQALQLQAGYWSLGTAAKAAGPGATIAGGITQRGTTGTARTSGGSTEASGTAGG